MKKIFAKFLGIPKTIYFNFRVFRFAQAIKLPVYIDSSIRIGEIHRGCIELQNSPSTFQVAIGTNGSNGVQHYAKGWLSCGKKARIVFRGKATFGVGTSIRVDEGILSFGDNFSANRNCFISCSKEVVFGENVVLGWNVKVRDADGHTLVEDGVKKKNKKTVLIGNQVWIAAEVDILKGVRIPDGSVVAYRSLVTSSFTDENVLIAGAPAKVIRKKIKWIY